MLVQSKLASYAMLIWNPDIRILTYIDYPTTQHMAYEIGRDEEHTKTGGFWGENCDCKILTYGREGPIDWMAETI